MTMSLNEDTSEQKIEAPAEADIPVLREHWLRILEKLIVENREFTVSFLIGDANDKEIPRPVRELRPTILTINFWNDGSIDEVEVKDGLLCFLAPFYSTLGSAYYLAVKLERIVRIQIFPPKPPAEDRRRGLRGV